MVGAWQWLWFATTSVSARTDSPWVTVCTVVERELRTDDARCVVRSRTCWSELPARVRDESCHDEELELLPPPATPAITPKPEPMKAPPMPPPPALVDDSLPPSICSSRWLPT